MLERLDGLVGDADAEGSEGDDRLRRLTRLRLCRCGGSAQSAVGWTPSAGGFSVGGWG